MCLKQRPLNMADTVDEREQIARIMPKSDQNYVRTRCWITRHMLTCCMIHLLLMTSIQPFLHLPVKQACRLDHLSAEHLIRARQEIYTLISLCFNGFIVRGFAPSFLTDTVLVPIVKDKQKDITERAVIIDPSLFHP